jgi:hypothetical protein
MLPVDPEPYVAVYVVLVFLVPWLIYVSFIVRKLLYARKSADFSHLIRCFSPDSRSSPE